MMVMFLWQVPKEKGGNLHFSVESFVDDAVGFIKNVSFRLFLSDLVKGTLP